MLFHSPLIPWHLLATATPRLATPALLLPATLILSSAFPATSLRRPLPTLLGAMAGAEAYTALVRGARIIGTVQPVGSGGASACLITCARLTVLRHSIAALPFVPHVLSLSSAFAVTFALWRIG